MYSKLFYLFFISISSLPLFVMDSNPSTQPPTKNLLTSLNPPLEEEIKEITLKCCVGSSYNPARRTQAQTNIRVNYMGKDIVIKMGSYYYTTLDGTVIVGFHGSIDPPQGM